MRSFHVVFLLGGLVGCVGEDGPAGPQGPAGQDGSGTDGKSSLVAVVVEPAGANCANGGQRIDVGLDDNGDGILDASEVDSTSYVCAGAPGATTLVAVTVEPDGNNCASGGQRIDVGVDDNNNSSLDASEIDETTYVCNGDDGTTTLIDIRAENPGANCADGGQRIDAGLDDDGDGVLDANEIDETAYVCNGESAATIPANATLWLRMDDDPTNGALDSAGTNQTTCSAGGCPALVAAQQGSGYQFTTDRLTTAPVAALQPGTAFSFGAWIRLDATPTENVVVGCKNFQTNDCSYAILVQPDRRVVYYTSGSSFLTSATPLTLGTWTHVTMTWDGATKRGFLNGVADGSMAATIGSDASLPLTFGQRAAATPLSFTGTIDEAVLYNRVLTAAEITLLSAR